MSFHLSAEDIEIDGSVLKAKLANIDGDMIDAEINLDRYIGNNNGSFEWGGENFSESADDISFDIEGDNDVPILRAKLTNTDGEEVSCNLNLSEHIVNDNGCFVYQ